MRILMISMFAPHFYNWTEQLKQAGHDIYWIDVFDSNTRVEKINFVNQIIGWRNRINYPGRYWLKKHSPRLSNLISIINQRDLANQVEKKIKEIEPDVIHSFVLQSAGYPLIDVMKKYPRMKWIFSAWGNDLYFRQQNEKDLIKIKKTLVHFDFMFADCERDFHIAKKYGFQGKFLGVFPTGGGYNFERYNQLIKPFESKNTVLLKGYEGKLGRCNNILKAVCDLKKELSQYEIKVFGANSKVLEFVANSSLNNWTNFTVFEKIPHDEVLKLMGESFLYIGNSISDGMPNTMLEAIIMEVFPIQSNPGGATNELIEDGKNGFIINNPEDPEEIKILIKKALNDQDRINEGIHFNVKRIKPNLERERVKKQVLKKYEIIEQSL
jgi:glycosyltransferase involved in cell wall biosynthesis